MKKVAILGYGVVGKQVYNQIKEKEDVMAKNKRRYENQISDKDKELEQIKKEKDDSKDKLKQINSCLHNI